MYVANEGGIVNSPSGGRWEARLGLGAQIDRHPNAYAHAKLRVNDAGTEEIFVRGSEREVMNHIGIVAPAPGETIEPTVATTSGSGGAPVTVERPRAPVVHLGRSREVLYPLGGAVALVAPLALGAWLWRRRRQRLLAKRVAT